MTNKIPVYKKMHNMKEYVKVGQVDEYGQVEFDEPAEKTLGNCIPHDFDPKFYIEIDEKDKFVKLEFAPKNSITQMVNFRNTLRTSNYPVTGYITDDGIAVYYNQYMNFSI